MASDDDFEHMEVELSDDYEPCVCGSTTRVVYATMKHRHLAFRCGQRHNRAWVYDGDPQGFWIPHYHFLPGGQFAGLLPAHFLGTPKAKSPNRKFDIIVRRKDVIQNEQRECASCHRPPMRDPHDREALVIGLKNYHLSVYRDVEAFVLVQKPRPTRTTWFDVLAASPRRDLAADIYALVRSSLLEADHAIPRAALIQLWETWTAPMRRMGTSTLAFGFCKECNIGKHDRLPTRAELLRWHIAFNAGDSERVARANAAEWQTLQAILDSVDDYRRTHSIIEPTGSTGSAGR